MTTSIPVEVQPPQHVREYIAMVMEGEYSADELRFVVYNDTTAYDWLLTEQSPAASSQGTPLVSDNKIFQLMKKHGVSGGLEQASTMNGANVAQAMLDMREKYEAELAMQKMKASIYWDTAESLGKKADELRAANAELERQLQEARAWQVVPDGWYDFNWNATIEPENPTLNKWSGYEVFRLQSNNAYQYVNLWSFGSLDTMAFNRGDTAICRLVQPASAPKGFPAAPGGDGGRDGEG